MNKLPIDWARVPELGRLPDQDVARILGCGWQTVIRARRRLDWVSSEVYRRRIEEEMRAEERRRQDADEVLAAEVRIGLLSIGVAPFVREASQFDPPNVLCVKLCACGREFEVVKKGVKKGRSRKWCSERCSGTAYKARRRGFDAAMIACIVAAAGLNRATRRRA